MKLKLLLFILLVASGIAYAEDLPGTRDSVFSAVLNEQRILQVYLPKDYKPGTQNKYHPANGIVLKDKPYTIYNVSGRRDMKYTIDGAAPNPESPMLDEKTILSSPAKLSIKAFTPGGKYKPLKKLENAIQGGLSYAYYEGTWTEMPLFKKLNPKQKGIATEDWNFNKLPSKINFACVFDGFIEIKEEGYYVLCTKADDGSKLYLNNKLLIDYVAINGERSLQSFLIPLKKGFYPIRLEYLQEEGNADLRLSYIVPGGTGPIEVPYDLLYSSKSK